MPKKLDLAGQVFGRLPVIGRSPQRVPATGPLARERGWTTSDVDVSLRVWRDGDHHDGPTAWRESGIVRLCPT